MKYKEHGIKLQVGQIWIAPTGSKQEIAMFDLDLVIFKSGSNVTSDVLRERFTLETDNLITK